jgi:hypothetical protein
MLHEARAVSVLCAGSDAARRSRGTCVGVHVGPELQATSARA